MGSEIDVLSTHWNTAQTIEWKSNTNPVLASCTLAVCAVAQILFYIFPRLRVFPRSLLSWVNLYNLTYMITIIMKWSKLSVLHEQWVIKLNSTSLICKVGIVIDTAGMIGPVCCTTLICLTLFLCVVLRIEIEGKRVYFWCYLTFATVYPVVIAIVAAYAYHADYVYGVCLIGQGGDLPIKSTYIALFVIQVLLFVVTMVFVKRAFSSVHTVSSSNFPMSYLVMRFSMMFFTQMFGLFPGQISTIFQHHTNVSGNAIFVRFVSVSRLLGPMLDAFVIITGNTDFVNWAKMQYLLLKNKIFKDQKEETPTATKSTETEMKEVHVQVREEAAATSDFDLESTHLTSAKMGRSALKRMSAEGKTSLEEQESSDLADGMA